MIFGALEHHVLEQVGKAGSTRLFVLRADFVQDIDGHDRRLVVLVKNHRQAIGKLVCLDLELGDLGFPRVGACGLGGACHRTPREDNDQCPIQAKDASCHPFHAFDPSLNKAAMYMGKRPTDEISPCAPIE